MVFMRKVSAKQLCGAWNDCLAANNPTASAGVKEGFADLCAMMADVGKGDTMVTAYVPGQGSAISVNGIAKGTIEGKDFADTLFACWIGDKPATEDLKQGMLGR